jgi:hypothetical protein
MTPASWSATLHTVLAVAAHKEYIILQGGKRPPGALPPPLPVSVRRSASLAKRSALLKGNGSQVNGLGWRCCEGIMFRDWSIVCCLVLLCYY